MSVVHFISHPEVEVDPAKSVPQWRLSAKGTFRMQSFAEAVAVPFVAVWSSDEMKAVEAAAILARQLGLSARIEHNLHENDRSATGFLPPLRVRARCQRFFCRAWGQRAWLGARNRCAGAYLRRRRPGAFSIVRWRCSDRRAWRRRDVVIVQVSGNPNQPGRRPAASGPSLGVRSPNPRSILPVEVDWLRSRPSSRSTMSHWTNAFMLGLPAKLVLVECRAKSPPVSDHGLIKVSRICREGTRLAQCGRLNAALMSAEAKTTTYCPV